MAKIDELKLEADELEAGKKRMKAMIAIYKRESWNKVEIEHHYSEWKKIAQRLKKGGEMLDNMQGVRPESLSHSEKLASLYTYLMKMLGLYDAFFKFMLQKNPEQYERAKYEVIQLTK